METGTILIVDDNKSVLASLELLLENEFSTVRTAANPNQITTLLTTTSIDIVILDMNFSAGINNGNEGLYWLKHIHEIRPALPVVMLTAYGDVELAVKALKNGATDFLLKPWDNRALVQKIKEAYNNKSNKKSSSKSKNSIVGSGNPNKPEMLIGHSPAMLQLIKVVNSSQDRRQYSDNRRKRDRKGNAGQRNTPLVSTQYSSHVKYRHGSYQ